MENKNLFKDYILALLITFAAFLAEPLAKLIEQLIYGIPYHQFNFTQNAVHFVVMIVLLSIWAYFVWAYVKEKFEFCLFESSKLPEKNNVLACLYILLVTVTISAALWNWSLKPVGEFFFYLDNELYSTLEAIALYVLLYIKYILEGILLFFIIRLGQKALSEKFTKFSSFYGGLCLACTWGILQIFTRGLTPGILMMVCALLYGITYNVLEKNNKVGLTFILLMFLM